MPSDPLDGQVVLVTGGGRGIGANIARELAGAGARVAVSARSKDEVEAVASEVSGLALVADVSKREDVERMVAEVESSLGPLDAARRQRRCRGPGRIDLGARSRRMVARPGDQRARCPPLLPDGDSGDARARARADRHHRAAAPPTCPGARRLRTRRARLAVARYGETLANELRGRIPVFFFSPGLVQTEMTSDFGRDLDWTPPELAPQLVHVLASGRADALAGRYIHAEHDDIEDLISRADEIVENDLNAIRLRR